MNARLLDTLGLLLFTAGAAMGAYLVEPLLATATACVLAGVSSLLLSWRYGGDE